MRALRTLGARLRARRIERASTKAERAQRRAQAEALRLEYKRDPRVGPGPGTGGDPGGL